MLSWGAVIPVFVLALFVLFAPGLAIAFAGGARRLRLWAVSAPLTLTTAGLGAILLPFAGLHLNPLTFTCITMLGVLVALLGRLVVVRRLGVGWAVPVGGRPPGPNPSPMRRLAPWIGLVIAAVVIGGRIISGITDPAAIAQLFDNVFHLNAVALVASTGEGSSLTLGNLTEASRSFYPAAFHDVAALMVQLSGAPVPVVMNSFALILCAVVWPLGAMYFTTRVFGARAEVFILTGALSGAFGSFPYRLLSFGVLYPFLAGLTMLPVLLGLIIEFFGRSRAGQSHQLPTFIAIAAISPGIALTHPSVLVAGALLGAPVALGALILSFRSRRTRSLVFATVYLVGTAGAFLFVRPPLNSAPWTPDQSYKEAIGAIVAVSPGSIAVPWVVCALLVLGLFGAARRPRSYASVVGMFAIGAIVYFACAAVDNETVRDLLAGVWYRDTERVSALLTIAAFALVVGGALVLATLARAALSRLGLPRRATARRLLALALCAGLILLGTFRGPIPQAQEWIHQSFGQHGVQQLLSDDERAIMQDVRELVPSDGVVVGSPRTGASLTPAFADRRALAPHIFGNRTPAEQYLLDHWDEAGMDPAVCEYVQELNAFWALDFGTDDVLGGVHTELAGTDALDAEQSPRITELARVGDAVLYEATACGPPA